MIWFFNIIFKKKKLFYSQISMDGQLRLFFSVISMHSFESESNLGEFKEGKFTFKIHPVAH